MLIQDCFTSNLIFNYFMTYLVISTENSLHILDMSIRKLDQRLAKNQWDPLIVFVYSRIEIDVVKFGPPFYLST